MAMMNRSSIDFSSMTDADDENDKVFIRECIDDAVISYSETPKNAVFASQRFSSAGIWKKSLSNCFENTAGVLFTYFFSGLF